MFEKLAVLGAGAVGSLIGGYLVRAGHDVTLIDPWATHIEAIRQSGLRITAEDEEFTVPVRAVHLGEASSLLEVFDAIFLCVKSYDTVWATHFLMPLLKPDGPIISAQNAMNDELIAPIVGFTRNIACVVTLGAGMYEPGHALRTGDPTTLSFILGELNGMVTERVQVLVDKMTTIGPTEATTNIWGHRWAKLATNSMANSVCALTGLGSTEQRRTDGAVNVSVKLATEVVRVGRALGVHVEPITSIPAEVYERAGNAQVMAELKTRLAAAVAHLGEGRPSMLQDVIKGRRTEIDYLNGYVVGKGREVGIPTPTNEVITRLVKRLERGELTPDLFNLQLLEQELQA